LHSIGIRPAVTIRQAQTACARPRSARRAFRDLAGQRGERRPVACV